MIPDAPYGGRDILDFVNDNTIAVSADVLAYLAEKKGAKLNKQGRGGDYDWLEKYQVPQHFRKFLFSENDAGNINEVAAMAHDEGLIDEPTPDALMSKILDTIDARQTYTFEVAQREKAAKEEEKQATAFDTSQRKLGRLKTKPAQSVPFDQMFAGDRMKIDGEEVEVLNVQTDQDGYPQTVTLKDGAKFGVLRFDASNGQGVLVNEWKPRTRESASFADGIDRSTNGPQSAPSHEPGIDSPAGIAVYDFIERSSLPRSQRELLDHVEGTFGVRLAPVARRMSDSAAQSGTSEAHARKNASRHFRGLESALETLFGKKVLFVRSMTGTALPFDALNTGKDRNTILIDMDASSPLMYLTGHELGHAIEAQNKPLYDRLKNVVFATIGDTTDYRAKLATFAREYQNPAVQDAEIVNDFIGSQFMEPGFWERLHATDQTLFEKIAASARRFLDAIVSKIAKLTRDVRPMFSDIVKARNELATILREYSKSDSFPQHGSLATGNDADFTRIDRSVTGDPKAHGQIHLTHEAERQRMEAEEKDPLPTGGQGTVEEWEAEARARVQEPGAAQALVSDIIEKQRTHTPAEYYILMHYAGALDAQIERTSAAVADPQTSEAERQQAAAILPGLNNERDRIATAAQIAGSKAGASLGARSRGLDRAIIPSLSQMVADLTLIDDPTGRRPLAPEERARIEKIHGEMTEKAAAVEQQENKASQDS